jgi:hypothetical protein
MDPERRNTPSQMCRQEIDHLSRTFLESARTETFVFVVGGRKVLGIIVSTVVLSGRPVKIELALGYAIFEPVVPHIKCFGAFHAYFGSEDVLGGGVVSFQRGAGGRLRVAYFLEGRDDGDGFLSVEEETARFGFGCRGGDALERLAEHADRAVGLGGRRVGCHHICEKEESGGSAASIGEDEIRCVRDDCEDHIAGMESDGGVWVGGQIVEKHVTGAPGFSVGLAWLLLISLRATMMV